VLLALAGLATLWVIGLVIGLVMGLLGFAVGAVFGLLRLFAPLLIPVAILAGIVWYIRRRYPAPPRPAQTEARLSRVDRLCREYERIERRLDTPDSSGGC